MEIYILHVNEMHHVLVAQSLQFTQLCSCFACKCVFEVFD